MGDFFVQKKLRGGVKKNYASRRHPGRRTETLKRSFSDNMKGCNHVATLIFCNYRMMVRKI